MGKQEPKKQPELPSAEDVVKIEPLAMQEEFVRMPADLAYWNAKLADVDKRFLLAKAQSEHSWAKLWLTTREKLLLSDGKATEKLIENTALADPEWQKAHLALVEVEAERSSIKGTVDAIRAKKEMLISLGATIRAEMDGDPMVRREHRMAHNQS